MTSIVLTSYRPHPPSGGAPLRNWQNINVLSSLGPVDVVSVCVDDTREAIDGIREWMPFSSASRSWWDRMKTACAPLRPATHPGVDAYSSGAVKGWLRDRASRGHYDLAVIETISLASYLPDLKGTAARVVFDAHNVEAALHRDMVTAEADLPMVQRFKNRVLTRRMLATEKHIVHAADLIWACSDFDAREIGRAYGRCSGVTVVPNAVDVEAYRRPGASPAGADWSGGPLTMLYAGLFAYPPNAEAARRLVREVLPAVRARGRDARVVLVGRDPTPALVEAARQVPGIELTGAVENVLPYLERPCIVTLPITVGSGTRLKILEAFAVGRPVVSTSKGAEGLDAVDGDHLLIRDDIRAIADAVVDLWDQASLRARVCERALALVRSRYSWSAAAERIAESLGVAPSTRRLGAGERRAVCDRIVPLANP